MIGLWMLWYCLDFPVSLGAGPFEQLFGQTIEFHSFYVFGFCFYFLILGGLQYYILGAFLVGLHLRLRSPE
ncbi:hypothetical protein [Rubripirellula obstinata]|nr:hypothetical protein [Rubripirellula obstinata]